MQEAIKYLTDNLNELKEGLTKTERKVLAEAIKNNLTERKSRKVTAGKLRRFDCVTTINSKRISIDVSIFDGQSHNITAWVTCVDVINQRYVSITI